MKPPAASEVSRETPQDDEISALLRAAGLRAAPPEAMRERIQTRVSAAFEAMPEPGFLQRMSRQKSEQPSAFLMRRLMPIAAALAVAVGALWWELRGPLMPALTVAEVAFTQGRVLAGERLLARGDVLSANEQVRTEADARLQLQLTNRVEVRVDGATLMQLQSQDAIELQRGRLYLASPGAAQLTVTTPAAVVRDIGTRFDVAVINSQLAVTVRDGRVQIEPDGKESVVAEAMEGRGEAVRLNSAGEMTREFIATTHSYWHWIDGARAAYQLDGGTLDDFLRWSAAECGLQLNYSDVSVEQAAQTTRVHGHLDAPCLAAVDEVLLTSRLQRNTQTDEHVLLIEFDAL